MHNVAVVVVIDIIFVIVIVIIIIVIVIVARANAAGLYPFLQGADSRSQDQNQDRSAGLTLLKSHPVD